jgi:hypothetical protein
MNLQEPPLQPQDMGLVFVTNPAGALWKYPAFLYVLWPPIGRTVAGGRRVKPCDQVAPQGVRKRHDNKCTGGRTRWCRCSPLRPPSRGRCATAAGAGAGDLRAACRPPLGAGRGAQQRVAVRHTGGARPHSQGCLLTTRAAWQYRQMDLVWNGGTGGWCMGCQKHDGHPSVVAGPATLAVYSVLPARSAVPVIRTATAANVPFGRNVSVFHRRQLGLLGVNATAAMWRRTAAVAAEACL